MAKSAIEKIWVIGDGDTTLLFKNKKKKRKKQLTILKPIERAVRMGQNLERPCFRAILKNRINQIVSVKMVGLTTSLLMLFVLTAKQFAR